MARNCEGKGNLTAVVDLVAVEEEHSCASLAIIQFALRVRILRARGLVTRVTSTSYQVRVAICIAVNAIEHH